MASLPTDVFVAACQLVETPSASATIQSLNELFSADICAALTKSGLLVDAPYLQDIEVEYEGELRSYPVERHDGNWRYFLQGSGWIQMSSASLKVSRVDILAYLKAMMSALDFEERATPEEIGENGGWYLGQAWLQSRKTHIVYVRRLGDENTISALTGFLEDRHKSDPALILTTGKNLPAYLQLPAQNRIVTLDDAINLQSEKLSFKTDYLARKMGGSVSVSGFSQGYRTLHSNGVEYSFSKKKASVLEFMDQAGKPMHQDEIMVESDSTQKRLIGLFRGDPAWKVIFKTDGNGVYWLEY